MEGRRRKCYDGTRVGYHAQERGGDAAWVSTIWRTGADMGAVTGWAGSIVSWLRRERRIIGLGIGAMLPPMLASPVSADPPRVQVQAGLQ